MKNEPESIPEVVRLLRLKRYEQPDADFDARNAAAIRTRLAALPERPGWGQRLWGLFEQTPSPALRYAAVTALVALVGVNVLTLSLTPPREAMSSMTNETPALAQQQAEAPSLAPTNDMPETYAKPVFVFEYPAIRSAPQGGTQYGTGPVVPVRFEP